MIRGVLILCAGILGLAVDARAACDIAGKVAELAPGFSPENYGNCAPGAACSFRAPTEFLAKSATASHAGDVALIVAAYNAAPPFFQAALCGLDRIYIDTDTKDPAKPSVWGMRERLTVDPATGRPRTHIGIAKALLSNIAKGRAPYATYEDQIARALLTPSPHPPVALSYSASPDPAKGSPATIAVLAILAHEMGHIVWWERDVGNSEFPTISWSGKGVQHGFHDFGIEDPTNPPQRRPVKADIQYDLRYLGAARAAEDLKAVYHGEWASLFATVAADEDFVETYKLVVLTDTGAGSKDRQALTGLKVTIARDGAVDVLANLNDADSKLHRKAEWVRDLVSK